MYRFAHNFLKEWKKKPNRKPLVIRGARQVGKSYLVRSFAGENFENFIEINFEKTPEMADLFKSNNPQKIIELLQIQFKTVINPSKTLLFLDEIQAAPHLIPTLRYFYEEMKNLALIAAGSLLEFILADHSFSMPVGRIEYLYLGPMTFEEFLLALGENPLLQFLNKYHMEDPIPLPFHQRLMELTKIFCLVGGMPEAVEAYVSDRSFSKCDVVKQSILATYQDDFGKYKKRTDHLLLTKIFRKIPLMIAEKIKYVTLDKESRSKDVSSILDLMELARIIYRVKHCSGNGPPLGAQVNDKIFKLLFLDVGLVSSACGLSLVDYEKEEDMVLVNQGKISEQFIGQHLLYSLPSYQPPELFYWVREEKSSQAEVDYLISKGSATIPVEVKSGKTGRLKSLHLFVKEKGVKCCLRFNSQPPKLETTPEIPKFFSLPFYLVGQARRLVS